MYAGEMWVICLWICLQGTGDFKAVKEKKGVFDGVEEETVIIGFINCSGCPGKKAALRASVSLFFCKKMKELIQKDLGKQARILDYTH